ncbi:MAG TPA: ABC-ATPase domain-containing protein [bacterium]|nr:ABC-ATPase domain-containing protein [bacterium]HPQ66926.1 ABC-ATPase domain-containing protein [bacterium]
MKTAEDLRRDLRRIDRKPYGFYKDLKGVYDFGSFRLTVDYVQPDPFAPPSQVAARLAAAEAGFPPELHSTPVRKTALEDCLVRYFHRRAPKASEGRSGTGHSGKLAIDRPSQEVLSRTAMVIGPDFVEARFVVGLPARGRTILGREAEEIFMNQIPGLIDAVLRYRNLDPEALRRFVEQAEDADFVRSRLGDRKLAAFVGNGALLPRASGIDDRPLAAAKAVLFQAPPELEVAFDCPNRGEVRGMGIPEGVTLIVGGGYHGKSTLLTALEKGVYNHIPGDGRELVVTAASAVKIRAEDGRAVAGVDISPFIKNLPLKLDTRDFSTQDASGSTSQAANIVEALEAGAQVLLVDEDTSATNFMIRDERMQALVASEKEPITPFLDRVRQLYLERGVSTVLVMGGSGDYFDVADTVIMMDEYRPRDRTAEAKRIAADFATRRAREGGERFGSIRSRIPLQRGFDPRRGKHEAKVGAKSRGQIAYGTHFIDLFQVEQLVDVSQTRAIADIVYYAQKRYIDGRRTLAEILDLVEADLDREGLDAVSPYLRGDLARPRRFEIAAAINRLRTLVCRQDVGEGAESRE